ncbi:hypothetical protein TI03_00495 [Achromatium sp. WMS1]|nr:hypothetical protein TI03_00495 [Achromatium sp. WMS1]
MNRITLWATLILALAVMISGIGVSYVKYLTRKEFSKLQIIKTECDQAETRWMRLQLEESTLTGYALIENRASQQLGLHALEDGEIKILR